MRGKNNPVTTMTEPDVTLRIPQSSGDRPADQAKADAMSDWNLSSLLESDTRRAKSMENVV